MGVQVDMCAHMHLSLTPIMCILCLLIAVLFWYFSYCFVFPILVAICLSAALCCSIIIHSKARCTFYTRGSKVFVLVLGIIKIGLCDLGKE